MPTAGTSSRLTLSTCVAWTGAALFLFSLLWSAYVYLIGFDTRSPSLAPAGAITFDVALFSLFALHHSLLARAGAKRLILRWAPAELERSIYTWTASLLFILVCTFWEPIPGTLYVLHGPWRVLAYVVQLAGAVLTIRSSAALDVLDLAGVRQVQRASAGTLPRHVALETRGLYGFVRHPLYFAWALMVCASPDMTATRATFAIVSTAYLAIAIPWEERSLVQIFGRDYVAYRKHVRWRMFPGVY
jgi:protein-S-isoprenylcysteine O-methyltransferase Ste14